jgi:hypothetical protein
MKKRSRYRDSVTGKFVAKSTWKRSRGQGGKRYERERFTPKRRVKRERKLPPLPPTVFEYIVSFTYDKSGRSFDVIVTATSAKTAREIAKEFLKHDKRGMNIARAKFIGWDLQTAKGKRSDEEAGQAEYRSESEEG